MDNQADDTDYPQEETEQAVPSAGEPPETSDADGGRRVSLDLPTGETVRITVENLPAEGGEGKVSPLGTFLVHPDGEVEQLDGSLQPARVSVGGASRRGRWAAWLPAVLFSLSLLVYLATRLIALEDFPIYFFTDEAAQTMLAADLLRDGLHGWEGDFLPTYFQNGSYYNLSLSVYLQVLPTMLFGRSVFVTRAVSVFTSLLAAFSVALILKDFLKSPYWWCGALLLSIAPAWFLHSRTAFETVVFVSFYAAMLYAYLLYRLRSPGFIYLTVLLAALSFYAYSPGQVIVAATGLLLLLSDLRYHWQNRRVVLGGALLGVLLMLPYLRFRLQHPMAAYVQLRLLDSYWLQPIPLGEKLGRFALTYLDGLSPRYWYTYHLRDLPRHVMKGYGHLLPLSLPFTLLGLLITLSRLRRSEYRVVLIAMLAGPFGSALVGVGITRLLVLVVPATLLAALGLGVVLRFLESPADALRNVGMASPTASLERWRLPRALLSLGLFAVLTAVNIAMLRDVQLNASTWYTDYGMGGMQYGAGQVFRAAQEILEQQPGTQIILTPTWTNGADVLARFFLGDPLPLQLGSIQGHIDRPLPLDASTLFITTPEEYHIARQSAKFAGLQVLETLPYPDGSPGFYFLRLRYSEDASATFAAEQQARRRLQQAEVQLDGQPVKVRHSMLDMGEISLAFDGDPFTFVRTLEANPLVVELDFPQARSLSGLTLITGSAQIAVTAEALGTPGDETYSFSAAHRGSVEEPELHLDFGEAIEMAGLRIQVWDEGQAEPAHIHVWEIIFDAE